MIVSLPSLMVGLASRVPGVASLTARRTGGSNSARYCYSIWMRHLVHLHSNGLPTRFGAMAELGPGDSLGIGLAALLSSVDRYVGLDRTSYAEPARNLAIFDELVGLVRSRADIPDERELPRVFPRLPSYAFPHHILPEEQLEAMLSPARLAALRDALRMPSASPRMSDLIAYVAPWTSDSLPADSVDLVLSQTVLQLPEDLPAVYRAMATWLKPGGIMSHEVDFKSIGRTQEWNGHWACSDRTWRLVQGRRRNHMNRLPVSAHRTMLGEFGLDFVKSVVEMRDDGITRMQLAPRFAGLSQVDLSTASALMLSRKPARASSSHSASAMSTVTVGQPSAISA